METTTKLSNPGSAATLSQSSVEALSEQLKDPSWLREKRLAAWKAFEALPMPQGRRADLGVLRTLNKFKLNQITPAVLSNGTSRFPAELQSRIEQENNGGLLLQHNGHAGQASLTAELKAQGVVFCSLEAAIQTHSDLVQRYLQTEANAEAGKFSALQNALWSGGAFLYVPQDVVIELPLLNLIHLDANSSAFGHTLIIAERGSRVTFIEEFSSSAGDAKAALYAGAAEVFPQEGAEVQFISLQDWARNMYSFVTRRSVTDKEANVRWLISDTGSKLLSTTLHNKLNGPGSASEFLGVFFTDSEQLYNMSSTNQHISPHTTADVLINGALTGKSRVEYEGLIQIEVGAQQTNSYLADNTLLLSDECRAESIPSLEIKANDVRASHGATMGEIDEEQLFYLMTRGLDRELARNVIVHGFFDPVFQRIPHESIRERLHQSIDRKLEL